ncbi:AMP-binding protein [Cryptosporangium sp. NPDC051539]|uniref:AMP-binding protein n=1 Tax=Cryptosporangium sp. NPDC051539 TaxID=3363962 RepID=UPI0037AB2B69
MADAVVISGDRQDQLSGVRSRAARLGAGLRSLGVGPGDRYGILMRNETGFLEANLAAQAIGAVPVPINWHWTGADLAHLLADSGVTVVVGHTDLLPAVERLAAPHVRLVEAPVPPEVARAYRLGDVPLTGRFPTTTELVDGHSEAAGGAAPPMSVIYTSGTTGLAKGILREPVTDAAALLGLLRRVMGFAPGGTTLLPAPLYHSAPNVAATFAAAMGLNLVILPRFDPEEFLRAVEGHRVTSVQMVPTMFVRLLQLPGEVRARYDVSSLESVVHAAAPCPPEVKRAIIGWFGPIVSEYYGGSEGGTWVHCDSAEWLAHPGTVGKPVLDARIKILGPDRREVPVGQIGVIYGRSPSVWPDFTYLNDDAKRRDIDAGDGFITVGDVGRVDADGFLYLTDRLNDMVISGGVNIYPAEIEACLSTLDGVADSAVFGVPDQDLGEVVAAHVQVRPGRTLSEADVREHVEHNLARYKVPRVVAFEAELPREDSGKLFKRRLKERYRNGSPGPAGPHDDEGAGHDRAGGGSRGGDDPLQQARPQ